MTALQDRLQASLKESYVIERELGGGGMSCVFLATEIALGRKVVIKVLPEDLAADVSIERFKREIQLAAQLQHPHIVPLLAAGVAGGLPYYTMPYVDGETLRTRIARVGELPVSDAVSILRDVVKGIAYAHRHHVVHRDIKPENVLLADESALVADFGVAKAITASVSDRVGVTGASLTSLGIALGTPAYMSPEQAAADPMTDHRADIYALSILAYEMLVGQAPFSGRTPQATLAAHIAEVPESITRRRPQIPSALAALIMRGLEKRPADRPQSAAEFLQILDAIATPSGGLPPSGINPGARRPTSRRTLLLGGLAALALIAAGGWFGTRGSTSNFVKSRVVIIPFSNKTGDPALASLGVMASDWITRSLSESRVADVALAPEASQSAQAELTAERIARLTRSTGAATVIGGSYYRIGDSVQFTAQVADASRKEVVQTVGPVSAPLSSPVNAIEQLRRRLVGVIAARLDTTSTDVADAANQPPSYEAYREHLAGDEAFRAGDYEVAAHHFIAAASIDSTFTYPLVRAAYAYENLNERSFPELDSLYSAKFDSVERVLRPRRSQMSAYDVAYLDRVIGWRRRDYSAAYVAGKRVGQIAPRSELARYVAARSAIPVNRMREAATGLDSLTLTWGIAGRDPGVTNDLAVVLHVLGEHERELETSRKAQSRFPQRLSPLTNELFALAALGRMADLTPKVENVLLAQPSYEGIPVVVVANVASELLWHGHPEQARTIAARALAAWSDDEEVLKRPGTFSARGISMINAALIAGKRDDAERILGTVTGISPVTLLGQRGVLAALNGDSAIARDLAAQIARIRNPWVGAASHFSRARIAAALGERDQAVTLLRSALSGGLSYELNFHLYPEFAPMRDYPPFAALLAPKG